MKKHLFMLVAVLALMSSGLMADIMVSTPADGDLWTEDSSYLSSWSSGNGGTISYTTDAQVGTYAVQDYKAASGYYVGPTLFFSGAPLDLSLGGTISFNMYAHVTNDLAWLNNGDCIQMEWRIYTTNGFFRVIANQPKGIWTFAADDLNITNFSPFEGTPDWSQVTGVGFYNLYWYSDATTIIVDGLHFSAVVVPEPLTASMLLVGSVVMAIRRRRSL